MQYLSFIIFEVAPKGCVTLPFRFAAAWPEDFAGYFLTEQRKSRNSM
jgi:hypothetical protein